MNPKAISLFCGAGGCSLGFKKANYDIIFATDIDQAALETYKKNFPKAKVLAADINQIDFEKLLSDLSLSAGELDFLLGGPPCQGFSTAGLRFWDDPRNSLLKSYVNALDKIKPKWFLMENVEGLLTANDGLYLYEATKAFVDLGYRIRVEKIYAHEYGIPQRRKRVFIIGNRLGVDFDLPEPTIRVKGRIFRNSDITLRHTISGLPKPSGERKEFSFYQDSPISEWDEQLRNGADNVTDHFALYLAKIQLERIRYLKQGQTMKDLPVELQHESFKRRSNRRVKDGMPSEKRGGAPSGIKRLIYDEPSLTITGASTREFIHPVEDRPLTIRECARIQTFPDSFIYEGNDAEKIQQIGNAIPPLLARIFAEHIKNDYGFTGESTANGSLISYSLTKSEGMSPALLKTKELLDKLKHQELQLTLF
ncbi:MAG: DNA cytosine methyltransferase [Anaerolineae bacterium]|nr:DNA cytosine methyltransferase [Anaerolineae bacterium]